MIRSKLSIIMAEILFPQKQKPAGSNLRASNSNNTSIAKKGGSPNE